ncbi:hypothetical protein [Shewanella xiamenensis]
MKYVASKHQKAFMADLERWTHPIQNWNLTLSQLSIHFEGA